MVLVLIMPLMSAAVNARVHTANSSMAPLYQLPLESNTCPPTLKSYDDAP